jgi:hypothetical protein
MATDFRILLPDIKANIKGIYEEKEKNNSSYWKMQLCCILFVKVHSRYA